MSYPLVDSSPRFNVVETTFGASAPEPIHMFPLTEFLLIFAQSNGDPVAIQLSMLNAGETLPIAPSIEISE